MGERIQKNLNSWNTDNFYPSYQNYESAPHPTPVKRRVWRGDFLDTLIAIVSILVVGAVFWAVSATLVNSAVAAFHTLNALLVSALLGFGLTSIGFALGASAMMVFFPVYLLALNLKDSW